MQKEYWFIVLAGILYGSITPGGQLLMERGLSLYEVTFYRSLFVFVFLLPIVLLKPAYMPRKGAILFYAVYGLIGGLLELLLFTGLALGVPVALTVLLLYTQPVWTVFLGRLLLGEKITLVKLGSVFLGLAGTAILLKSWEASHVGTLGGITSALAAGLLLSLWVILGKKSALLNQHYITTTIGWSGFASLWLLVLLPLFNLLVQDKHLANLSFGLTRSNWIYLAAFALLGGAIPHLLFYRSLERISASVAGIVLLLEPVSATVIAWIFLSQRIGLYILLGGIFILLANYLVINSERNRPPAF